MSPSFLRALPPRSASVLHDTFLPPSIEIKISRGWGGGGEKGSAVNAAIEMLSDSAMAESMSMRLLFSLVVVDTAERE